MPNEQGRNTGVELTIIVGQRDVEVIKSVASHLHDIKFRRDLERLLAAAQAREKNESQPTSEALAPY
jgi:hypothetical protein